MMKKSIFVLIFLVSFLLLSSIVSAQFIPLDIISKFFNSILRIFGITPTATTSEKVIPSSGTIVYPTHNIYFQCTFSKEGQNLYAMNKYWPPIEPSQYQCEKGTWHWVNCKNETHANPDWNAGRLLLINDPIDTSRLCLKMLLDTQNTTGAQHCKLYEMQDAEPYYVPAEQGLYYSAKYWFPEGWSFEEWRLIMQWGDTYADKGYPTMGLWWRGWGRGTLCFEQDAYADPQGEHRIWDTGINYMDIPKEKWIDIVVYVKPSSYWTRNGVVKIWIDGVLKIDINDICTCLRSGYQNFQWGIGNYGGPKEKQEQYILVKDVVVSDTL